MNNYIMIGNEIMEILPLSSKQGVLIIAIDTKSKKLVKIRVKRNVDEKKGRK